MFRPRVIPVLLLRGHGLVKTKKFKDAVYVGDPVNAVRIFSEKEADEIVILDIDASKEGREPNYDLIEEIAGECLMPMAYGGGVRSYDQVRRLIRSGVEKVVINSAAASGDLGVITQSSQAFGSQAIVGGIDVRHSMLKGYRVVARSATVETALKLEEHARELVRAGAGEILINNVDADGTMAGFDLKLIRRVADAVNVPVVACGGAGSIQHLRSALSEGGASAVAAGSMFVFHGKHRAVLINYNPHELPVS
ncbi:AglZ/HisF2 family acetamidino modification protein [Gellertiella hungarica]|uniref:Imidazole glycerol phosphate synthase subunit HisF n=1 Tax=Gellertiella hungarica TaxID=1572859 RepID=A0A7W6J5D3_9HYPH|nr:AglZ/HisF2 family acetamidino modification protein [Gellertiella hungarica]MBB4064218.1 cyclase [Gellertiella hungarica]